ncbi:MAG: hypothetical protein RR769_05580, partial [Anaerovoracaceae bacterium]
IAAKDILEDLPILYCPNCMSELSEETVKKGLCENCNKKTIEEKILNSATLKKTYNDSIIEAQELLGIKKNLLSQNKVEIMQLEKSIKEEKKRLFTESKEEKSVFQESILDIKQRLEFLIKRENELLQYKRTKISLDNAKQNKKEVLDELKELQEELLKADNKATSAMEHYDLFKTKFSEYLRKIFVEIDKCDLDEFYMPLIDENKITTVSSASLKVAIRITYILALLISNANENGGHIGFLLLDSPKDKDLDDYRFEKYLELINMESNTSQGQIFITGSLSDKELYYNKLSNAHFFEELTTESKLLK